MTVRNLAGHWHRNRVTPSAYAFLMALSSDTTSSTSTVAVARGAIDGLKILNVRVMGRR